MMILVKLCLCVCGNGVKQIGHQPVDMVANYGCC